MHTVRGNVVAPPAGDWTLTVGVRQQKTANTFMGVGLLLTDGTQSVVMMTYSPVTQQMPSMTVGKSTAPTTFSSSVDRPLDLASSSPLFLRVIKVSTNRTYQYSFDGQNWITFVASSAAFLTETGVGIGGFCRDSAALGSTTLLSAVFFHYEITTGAPTNFTPSHLGVW